MCHVRESFNIFRFEPKSSKWKIVPVEFEKSRDQ